MTAEPSQQLSWGATDNTTETGSPFFSPIPFTVLVFGPDPGMRYEVQQQELTNHPPSSPTACSLTVPLTLPSPLSPGPSAPVSLAQAWAHGGDVGTSIHSVC